ncbi:hypothetical protein TNCV_840371 [Trichonephila clavipes]|nr:hypothetical protein TNCV_840371 [Trichonephila clavipes]
MSPFICYNSCVDSGPRGALLKLESSCYSYGARSLDDVTILQRQKDEILGSPTTLCIVGMYVTIYVTVASPPGELVPFSFPELATPHLQLQTPDRFESVEVQKLHTGEVRKFGE